MPEGPPRAAPLFVRDNLTYTYDYVEKSLNLPQREDFECEFDFQAEKTECQKQANPRQFSTTSSLPAASCFLR